MSTQLRAGLLLLALLSTQCQQQQAGVSNGGTPITTPKNEPAAETRAAAHAPAGAAGDSRETGNTPGGQADTFNLRVDDRLDGKIFRAYVVAYESFKADSLIPEPKRAVENYEVQLRQDRDFYYILFLAKRPESEKNLRGGESALGMDVMYTVRKTNYELVSRKFFE